MAAYGLLYDSALHDLPRLGVVAHPACDVQGGALPHGVRVVAIGRWGAGGVDCLARVGLGHGCLRRSVRFVGLPSWAVTRCPFWSTLTPLGSLLRVWVECRLLKGSNFAVSAFGGQGEVIQGLVVGLGLLA